eukprot:TRINITY_DN12982_c0_g1_i2.p1 TRINITY_DN12982_c0_g1~~TRINITY_DN12982_c0_g1_i2.p1  ORF type:complete len:122 (+),score=14.03 TRINITY_DN12982_c0_g1_i2:232-597(+)
MDGFKCNARYRQLGSFQKYYNGQLQAPVLTIVVGGNHEASVYMQELSFGGWLAPNIYYLGTAGVVTVAGLRIAGWSGIQDTEVDMSHRLYRAYSFYVRKPSDNLQVASVARATAVATDGYC